MCPETRGVALAPSLTAVAERCYASAYHALASGDLTPATHLFGVLALLEPHGERAWVGLGACQERAGRPAAALTVYTLGHTLTGGASPWLGLGRARTLRALGRSQQAERAFDLAEAAADDPRVLRAIQEER